VPLIAVMEFVLVLRELFRHRLLLALGLLVAAVAAVFSVYRVDGSSLKARSLQYSGANSQILVDSPKSVLGNLSQDFEPLSIRAAVYANFMASPAVLDVIGRQVGLSGEQIYAAGPVNAQQPRVVQEPTALKRNVQITGETNPYRLSFSNNPGQPTINVYAQAPTTEQAVALANAAVVGLQRYVAGLQHSSDTPQAAKVTIRQLGPAIGGVVNGGISKALAGLVFVGVFLLWCVLILLGMRFRENWRASSTLRDEIQTARQSAGEPDALESSATLDGHADTREAPAANEPVAHHEDLFRVPTRSAR
jgi:hypothetical protein